MSQTPYATHADLSALRREIQLDVRGEMREFMTEVRQAVRELETRTATQKQWAWNLFFSVANVGVAAVYVIWSMSVH